VYFHTPTGLQNEIELIGFQTIFAFTLFILDLYCDVKNISV